MTAFCIPSGKRHESEEKPCQLKGTKLELSNNYFGLQSRNQSRRTNQKTTVLRGIRVYITVRLCSEFLRIGTYIQNWSISCIGNDRVYNSQLNFMNHCKRDLIK